MDKHKIKPWEVEDVDERLERETQERVKHGSMGKDMKALRRIVRRQGKVDKTN